MKQVTCPGCKKKTLYSSTNPHRPFCSDRCRLIDLGAWASDSYRVAATAVNEDSDLLSEYEADDPELH